MIDHIETLRQLYLVGEFYCPIIKGRNNPELYVSIPRGNPIPEGWVQCATIPGYYPDDTIRIKLTY